MVKKEVKKYLIVASLLLLVYLSYLIIKPFVISLITSFVLAYLFYPLYRRINNLTKNRILSATIVTGLIIIIVLVPLVTIARSLITESIALYNSGIIEESTNNFLQYFSSNNYLSSTINILISKFVGYLEQKSAEFLISLPSKIFHLLVITYTTFSLFLVGENFLRKAKSILPTKEKDALVKHIGDTTYSIVYGLFLTAIIEFIIALITFKIIGTESAILLSLIIGFLAFIPFLGPIVIWLPYAIIEITRNNYRNVIILIILGGILFIIDTFLKIKIIGSHSKVHPIIILIGTIGGIQVMGFIGIVVGPVLLSGFITILKDYYPLIKNETES